MGSFLSYGIPRYVGRDLVKKKYAKFRIFDKLLLTVQRGTGLVSYGERCYNMVRYWAVLGAGLCSWCALCRNGVVVRDDATQFDEFPAFLTRLEWPSSCSARETMVDLGYVTRGLGLVVVLFALLVPFSSIGIDGDGMSCFWTRICRFCG